VTELDIWRSANILLKRYKDEALFMASKRAEPSGRCRGLAMFCCGN
jgi:hypothetical protein